MSKFNQLKIALEKARIRENSSEASLEHRGSTESSRSDESVRKECSSVRDHEQDAGGDVRSVPESGDRDRIKEAYVEPTIPLTPGLGVRHPHLTQWRLGARLFDYDVNDMPKPRGLIIGECPGPNTDPRMPLFPNSPNSVGARLLGFAPMSERDFMGLLMRTNLCPTVWDDDVAAMRVETLKLALLRQETPPRVLLLGRKVANAWRVARRQDFDWCRLVFDDKKLEIAWIPYPSGLNRIYNDVGNQKLAGRFVMWAAGLEKELPYE